MDFGCKNHSSHGSNLKQTLQSLLPISLWIMKSIILRKQHGQNQDIATDLDDEVEVVEKGMKIERNEMEMHTQSSSSEIQINMDVITHFQEEQMVQNTLQECHHKFVVTIERMETRDANKAQVNLLPFQRIGLEIIKIWVLPLSQVLIAILFQVVTTNQGVKPTKTLFALKPYFASLMITFVLGAMVLALSYPTRKIRGKMFVTKIMIIATFTSSTVNLGLLIALGWWLV